MMKNNGEDSHRPDKIEAKNAFFFGVHNKVGGVIEWLACRKPTKCRFLS
jgi:hypothetical protein